MATDICIRVGEQIRLLREERGWRQIDLAEHAHIHKNHISEVERGQREVGLRALEAIAVALGVRTSEILQAADS